MFGRTLQTNRDSSYRVSSNRVFLSCLASPCGSLTNSAWQVGATPELNGHWTPEADKQSAWVERVPRRNSNRWTIQRFPPQTSNLCEVAAGTSIIPNQSTDMPCVSLLRSSARPQKACCLRRPSQFKRIFSIHIRKSTSNLMDTRLKDWPASVGASTLPANLARRQ